MALGWLTPFACYRPAVIDCAAHCGDDGACGQGQWCSAGVCTRGPACPPPDAGPPETIPSCQVGLLRCANDVVLRCGQLAAEEPHWIEELTCADPTPVCFDGGCVACIPGAASCRDNVPRLC